MMKTVVGLGWDTMTPKATFLLDADGNVHADYLDDRFRRQVDEGIVWSVDTGSVYPKDGAVFMQVLNGVFCQSSRIGVIDGLHTKEITQ